LLLKTLKIGTMRTKCVKDLSRCIPTTHKSCRLCGIVITRTNFSRHIKNQHGGPSLTMRILNGLTKAEPGETVDLTQANSRDDVSTPVESGSSYAHAGQDVPRAVECKREAGSDVGGSQSVNTVPAGEGEFQDWTMVVPGSEEELDAVIKDLLATKTDEETLRELLQKGPRTMLDTVCRGLGLELRVSQASTSVIDTSVLTRTEKLKLYKKLGAELMEDF